MTLDQIAVFVGIVVGLGALLAAVGAILKAIKASWAWLRRFFKTVDVIASIPGRLDKIEGRIDSMAADIEVTKHVAVEVHHEVRNNGGSSLKDSAHRIESALGLADPPRTHGNTEREPDYEAPSAS